MRIQFSLNGGHGVEQAGIRDFDTLVDAKGEAVLLLARSLQKDIENPGVFTSTIAGLSEDGTPEFSVAMHITVD